MEYEIEDEYLLFDDSTNPSLKHEGDQAERKRRASPQRDPAEKHDLQKGELIPEEEEEHQLA